MALRLEAGGEPDLPQLSPEYSFLVSYLFDAGPTSRGGQFGTVLTWPDLQAWQAGAGVSLPAWQLRMLRHLSAQYLSESIRADTHDAPPPWEREPDRERVAKHIKRIMRG